MTADLESMKDAGLGNLVFLEVNVGVPRGPIIFMGEQWQELFSHAVHEAQRLGIDITLGIGPGWTGSGGPWVKAEQSMQHLVFSVIDVHGPSKFDAVLPVPEQRSTKWHKMESPFYEDVAVYAFARCKPIIFDINEKALYERNPYSSMPGVKPYLPAPAYYQEPACEDVISIEKVVNLTKSLESDGRFRWDVPAGEWTLLRMGRRSTGAGTRPAPIPGVGLECDKLDVAAFEDHFENFVGQLLKKVGPRKKEHGWTTLHMDSWEMGAQNWTQSFCDEFKKRRNYDPMPYLPAYTGRAVESVEMTERFLWDVRTVCQELVLENYAGRTKELGRKYDLELSIEPYDMNPTADLDLGAVADVPMAEFWSAGLGFDTSFSCIEASSIAHTMGRPIVSAEAFTAIRSEAWQQYPGSMKNQGDWAFCMGINRFVYHTFAHQPLGEEYRPGMTMGPYGVHWDRGQTWWPMVKDYHRYVSRCSHLLRQGVTVSDILYLTPEGAPHIFRPPSSALEGKGPLADKKGYGFDGCSPAILMERADVQDGKIVFPGGSSYDLMVLPRFETMTPKLLKKIKNLIEAGATVVGSPPLKSPGLFDYPQCDRQVQTLAKKLWGTYDTPKRITKRQYGKGCIFWGGDISKSVVRSNDDLNNLYPSYEITATLLQKKGVPEDFSASGPIRFTHRRTGERDIYFVSNRSEQRMDVKSVFRVQGGQPELWHPVNGEQRILPEYTVKSGTISIPLRFKPYESYFVTFSQKGKPKTFGSPAKKNFPSQAVIAKIEGPWDVAFDPNWGGPEHAAFETLRDWTNHSTKEIQYYSGIATYRKRFDCPAGVPMDGRIYLDLGIVHDMARIKLNGRDFGAVWCAPWQVEISDAVKPLDNHLEIEVANRWPNRLIGDQQLENKNIRSVKWDNGFLDGKTYQTGRYTFTTHPYYKADAPLMPSGLLGPVTILREEGLEN